MTFVAFEPLDDAPTVKETQTRISITFDPVQFF